MASESLMNPHLTAKSNSGERYAAYCHRKRLTDKMMSPADVSDILKYVMELKSKKNVIVLLTAGEAISDFLAPVCCHLTWIVLITGNLKKKTGFRIYSQLNRNRQQKILC